MTDNPPAPAPVAASPQEPMTCWWCHRTTPPPMVCNDAQTIAMCGVCAQKIADFLQPSAAQEPAETPPAHCEWIPEDEDGGCYQTSCGRAFSTDDGDPPDFITFCCYCGKPADVLPAPALPDTETP